MKICGVQLVCVDRNVDLYKSDLASINCTADTAYELYLIFATLGATPQNKDWCPVSEEVNARDFACDPETLGVYFLYGWDDVGCPLEFAINPDMTINFV